MQSSSHNFPKEINVALCSSFKTWAVQACFERHDGRGRSPTVVEEMAASFGRLTVEEYSEAQMLDNAVLSWSLT